MHTVVRGAGALGLAVPPPATHTGCQADHPSAAEPAPSSPTTGPSGGRTVAGHQPLDWPGRPPPSAAQAGSATAPAGARQCAT
ncbi:hypothetical protein VM98_33775, partial [Streptomyces rubellomurinus subsp. indigoferus]